MIHQVIPDQHERLRRANKNCKNTSHASILTPHRVKEETIGKYRSIHDTGQNFYRQYTLRNKSSESCRREIVERVCEECDGPGIALASETVAL